MLEHQKKTAAPQQAVKPFQLAGKKAQGHQNKEDEHLGPHGEKTVCHITTNPFLSTADSAKAMQDKESFSYPDYTYEDAEQDLLDFMVKVYSSKEIEKGTFVSPSKRMVEDYAGSGIVYDKIVYLDEVAWINADKGIYIGKTIITDEEL